MSNGIDYTIEKLENQDETLHSPGKFLLADTVLRLMDENKALKEQFDALSCACIEHLSPKCECIPEYKDRDLRDPQCEYCNIGKFIYPILLESLKEKETETEDLGVSNE